MKEFSFVNSYKDILYGNKWKIESPSKILVIVTGMAEHSERYDDFANFLNSKGISVYCLDHYGQGKNGIPMNPGKDYFFKMQDTVKELIGELKSKYNLPIYIMGHSMGSFVTQGYLEKYSSTVDKAVIMGSNGPTVTFKMGYLLSKMLINDKNYNDKAKLFYNLSLGGYEKSVKNSKTNCDWLSYNEENVKAYIEDPLSGVHPTNGFFKEFMKGLNSIQKPKNVKNINKNLPILIVGGEDDPVGNFSKGLKKLFKLYSNNGLNVNLKIYKNMRHEILNEKNKDDVYQDLFEFFDK